MKKTLLNLAFACGFATSAFAQFGNCTPSEKWQYIDKVTGQTITVLTDTTKDRKSVV